MLSHVRFTMLAMGDSNYSTFMGAPTDFKTGLEMLGAKFFYMMGKSDEGVDLEAGVNEFEAGLWTALETELKSFSQSDSAPEGAVAEDEEMK